MSQPWRKNLGNRTDGPVVFIYLNQDSNPRPDLAIVCFEQRPGHPLILQFCHNLFFCGKQEIFWWEEEKQNSIFFELLWLMKKHFFSFGETFVGDVFKFSSSFSFCWEKGREWERKGDIVRGRKRGKKKVREINKERKRKRRRRRKKNKKKWIELG